MLRGNGPAQVVGGSVRYALNGVSYLTPTTPPKLADYFNLAGIYTLDTFPTMPTSLTGPIPIAYVTSVITGGYRGFMEIIFENVDNVPQSYHLDGYAFFVVGYVKKPHCNVLLTH